MTVSEEEENSGIIAPKQIPLPKGVGKIQPLKMESILQEKT